MDAARDSSIRHVREENLLTRTSCESHITARKATRCGELFCPKTKVINKMNRMIPTQTVSAFLLLTLLCGCCSNRRVADPRDITLKAALVSVAKGLDAMRASATNAPFGLFPKEVEVTFNISASRVNTGELHVDLSAPTASPVVPSAGGSTSFTSTATRGNQITITFGNVLTLHPKDTLLGEEKTNIITLIHALNEAGVIVRK